LIGADGDAGRRHQERLACQNFSDLPALPRDREESDRQRDVPRKKLDGSIRVPPPPSA
jgi:hypothetical protein